MHKTRQKKYKKKIPRIHREGGRPGVVHVHATAAAAPPTGKTTVSPQNPGVGPAWGPVVAQEATGEPGRARTEGVRTLKRYYLLPAAAAEHLIPSH